MVREQWGSKLGVILAVAGSAVGLGNFLRFPAQVAQNGGGAYMIPYFVALLLLGLPLMWIEWTIGRYGGGFGHSTAPGIFHSLANKNRFIKYFGVIGIFGPTVIFIYYVYVESWLLGYCFFALTGKFCGMVTPEAMKGLLHDYQGLTPGASLATAYVFFVITFLMNLWILMRGIRRGIEMVCKVGLFVLFIFAIILMVRVLTLGTPDSALPDYNITNGLGYMWNPDWSMLWSGKVWIAAAGQIFFTLSVGIGVILTYASYLKKQDDVVLSGLTAAATNEFAEVILGGSLVIPLAFAYFGPANMTDIARSGTFNLGFITMPLALQHMGMGGFFGFLWFSLLFLAGLTSSISLAQPAIAFLEDEFDCSKRNATLVFGAATFILCQPAIFFLGQGVVDEMDFWGVNFCLVIFGTVETILFSWVFGMDNAWNELHQGSNITIPRIYRFIIKYVTPIFLLTIIGTWFFQDWLVVFRMEGVSAEHKPYIIGTRLLLLGLLLLLVILVHLAWRRKARRDTAIPR